MDQQPILEAELLWTMLLIAIPILIISVVGFILFARWSNRERYLRAREIELEEARRNRD